MEEKEEVVAKAQPKVSKGSSKIYIAVAGFDTSDERRFEIGDRVDGLKPADLEALLEMGAIESEGK